jgi:hypothetical protein
VKPRKIAHSPAGKNKNRRAFTIPPFTMAMRGGN